MVVTICLPSHDSTPVIDCDIGNSSYRLKASSLSTPSPTSYLIKASLYARHVHVTRSLVCSSQLESSHNPRTSQSRLYQYANPHQPPTSRSLHIRDENIIRLQSSPMKHYDVHKAACRPNSITPFKPQLPFSGRGHMPFYPHSSHPYIRLQAYHRKRWPIGTVDLDRWMHKTQCIYLSALWGWSC
jgi:hypothetical protein